MMLCRFEDRRRIAQHRAHFFAECNLTVHVFGARFQPEGFVHDIAQSDVIGAGAAPQIADRRDAGVDAGANQNGTEQIEPFFEPLGQSMRLHGRLEYRAQHGLGVVLGVMDPDRQRGI